MENNQLEISLKSLPKKEKIAVRYYNRKHQLIYVSTYSLLDFCYKLYRVKDDKLVFTKHKNTAANVLEKHVNYNEEVKV